MTNNNEQSFQDWFASKVEELHDNPSFILEGVLYDLTEQIVEEMEKQGISRSELARKMGKKPSFITRILRGNENLTFSTTVQIGLALGMKPHVEFIPLDSSEKKNCRSSSTECLTLATASK